MTKKLHKTDVGTLSSRASGFALCTLLLFLALLGAAQNAEAQTKRVTVSGKVIDTDGNPIVGVAVIVQGTTKGVLTDADGNYSIKDVLSNATIDFQMIGYVKQSKAVGGAKQVNAILYDDTQAMESVEVVAFGTQKKESVIGAISTVSASQLKSPSSNLTNSLAGRVAGVISYQRSGEPGVDDASFFIRGVTTFGYKKDPLILIDGIELTSNDLARLQPDDIESFSIMKDATATALYGARGANGVILVKTKEGRKGQVKVNIRLENSISTPTKLLELADPTTYMKLHNEALLTRDPMAPLMYSQDKIDNTMPGSGSMIYPYTDWSKMMMKDYTMNQRMNLNVSGGGDVARYYVAASYSRDNGILRNDNSSKFDNNIALNVYTLRSNINIDLTKTTEMIVRMSGNFEDNKGPLFGGSEMYKMVMQSNPVLFPSQYPISKAPYAQHVLYGNADDGAYLNPYAEMTRGYKTSGRSNMSAQFEVKQDLKFITKGLSARVMFNASRVSNFALFRYMKPFYYKLTSYDRPSGDYNIMNINPDGGTDFLIFDDNKTVRTIASNLYLEGAVNYNREFGKHGVSGLLVYQLRNNHQPNAATLQTSLPYRNVGLSGRATYSYNSRYFAEVNFGYNGTERFHENNRFGFFPSAGAAWLISNEKFFKPLKKTITNLKLRASYGLVGNDQIGANRFLYLSDVNMDNPDYSAEFGYESKGDFSNGISVKRYADPTITWETSTKTNFALEVSIRDKFNLTAEYYTEHRTSILMRRSSIPASMGLWVQPEVNAGEAKGSGVDVSVDYNKYFANKSWLQVRGNFTYAKSRYIKYEDNEYPGAWWKNRVNYPTNQKWGYIAEGLFVDEQEVANSPKQFGDYKAGDIKYRDVNGDFVIDDLDMVPIGYPTEPEIVYGFGASYGYKGWDVSLFFQGLARESFWLDYAKVSPFVDAIGDDGYGRNPIGHNQLARFIADSYWSEGNRNTYATWPRLSSSPIENNNKPNTWFMRDGSFLRLKQVELGYTLPDHISKKIGMKSLRIYFSGNNLLCFSKFKLWDPEMAGDGLGYPVQRVFNIGLNINF